MAVLILFGAGFVMCVAGIFVFIKSDETAFSKAKEQISEMRGALTDSINKAIKESMAAQQLGNDERVESLIRKVQEEMSKIDTHLNDTKADAHAAQIKSGANELEIRRIKEQLKELSKPHPVPPALPTKIEIFAKEAIPMDIIKMPPREAAPRAPRKTKQNEPISVGP